MDGNVLYSLIVIFFMVIYFMLLFTVVIDLFRQHMNGWLKALWIILLLVLPFISLLVYVIVYGRGMSQRQADMVQQAQKQQAEYIRTVADSGTAASATDEIAKGQELLKSGAITQEEFDALKAKALAS